MCKLQITATIVDYIPNAMHDNFDDGSFEFYDATKVRVVAPENLAEQEFSIYHIGEVPEDSLWRIINQRIRFDLNKKELGRGIMFDGAVSNLRVENVGGG